MKVPNASASRFGGLGQLSLSELNKLRERSQRRRARAPALVRSDRRDPPPLSYAQERLWFLDQVGLTGPRYNSQMVLRLQGSLDAGMLDCSFTEVIRRHESLRTRFRSIGGSPVQMIDVPRRFALEVQDISGLDAVDSEVQRRAEIDSQRRFDLAERPLLCASLLKLAEEDHVLLVTMHHIVTDGWSWGVLFRELGELYAAYSQGRTSSLPELAVQYADYAIWQRQWLQGEVLERQLQYWRGKLDGVAAELELPTDRPRQAIASFNGARVGFELSAESRRFLEGMARGEGATLFMALLAAYQVLLSRYCGQDDVVVGAPVAGRTHAHTESLIGFFVNTLVLRTDLSGNPGFRQLLGRVREVTLGAYAHQDLPFEQLVMELRPERNLTRQPIFQVVLAMQNYPQEPLQLPGLTWTRIETTHATAPFDLTLHVLELPGGGLRGEFVYATDLFDRQTIERMAAHLSTIVAGIVADPDCPIQQLQMLTPHERHQVLYGFNDTATEYPQHTLIHELFEQHAQRSPGSIAVLYEGQALTYAELNNKANQLACYLREQGVQIGEYVPILMSRCLQMLVAQLAVLKSGAVYVPVDPSMPAERQLFIVRDCRAQRVLTERGDRGALQQEDIQWIDCSKVTDRLAVLPNVALNLPTNSPQPAYVMYTSGSTGIPKGVIVPHRAVNRLVINNSYARIEASDCIAHCSNPAFDASTFEIWGALLNGARVLIVPQWDILDAKRFAQVLTEQRVTVLWLTIGLFMQYADALASVFKNLRYLMTGGDIVEPGTVRRVLLGCPPRHLLNAYGPTECTTFSTTYPIKAVADGTKSIPIGRPISNTSVYILDGELQPVPIGVTGEMYIGGPGLALSYLDRPELTKERFIKDPFSKDSRARLYKTGDLARWRTDGNIDFVGRNDQQVKLRGFRVELGEIEAQLVRFHKIKEAAVITREAGAMGKRLVAYLTLRETDLDVTELRAYLAASLPEYMVPSAFVVLERLPLTPNGKLDRRALPTSESEAHASQEYERPQSQLEETLAVIWQELLGTERVGRRDNFFDLGGHSLLVLKALFKINEAFGCALNVRDVYQSPTLHELAGRISGCAFDEKFVNLSEEATLDESVVATSEVRVQTRVVMLTGGAGFVGRFLLAQLLQATDATVYCLVRAPSSQQALARLRVGLAEWDLWRDEFESRIVAIAGDLRLPRLGLDEDVWRELSQNVDSIFHCATSMNHLETYAMAKQANVEATKELLKLATLHKTKLVNHISSLSVFGPSGGGAKRFVNETTSIDEERHSTRNGYAASKWVSEKIISIAAGRGIPCNIFRLGLVWADTKYGHYGEMQRESMVLRSCLLSNSGIESYRYEMALTPVDYVARAVVHLATKHDHGGGIFHIASRSEMASGLFERCNEVAGTSLNLMPLYDWIHEIKRLHDAGRSLPIVPLVEFAFSMDRETFDEHRRRIRSAHIHFDSATTHHELESVGIRAPALSDDLIRTCVENMIASDPELDMSFQFRGGATLAERQGAA